MSEKGESSLSNSRSCAVCRYQRRRCRSGCILARHFPTERAAQFEAVRRHFGVSNLLKFYNAASSEQRNDLIKSMTYEAEFRRANPVLGCVAVIRELTARIDAVSLELIATASQLSFHRRLQQKQQQEIRMQQLLLTAQQQQEQQQMMMPPPLEPMLELHAYPLPLQQQEQLPPPLLPPILMNLDDKGVDIGRMTEDEGGGSSRGSRPLDEEAIRSFNPMAAPPNNPVVDPRSHMPGSSNPEGLDELYEIQGWTQEQGLDGATDATGDLFIHNFNREPPSSG